MRACMHALEYVCVRVCVCLGGGGEEGVRARARARLKYEASCDAFGAVNVSAV